MSIQTKISSEVSRLVAKQYPDSKVALDVDEAKSALKSLIDGASKSEAVKRLRNLASANRGALIGAGTGYLGGRLQSALSGEDEGESKRRRMLYMLLGGAGGLGYDAFQRHARNTRNDVLTDALHGGSVGDVAAGPIVRDSEGKLRYAEQSGLGFKPDITSTIAGGAAGAGLGIASETDSYARRQGAKLRKKSPLIYADQVLGSVAGSGKYDATLSNLSQGKGSNRPIYSPKTKSSPANFDARRLGDAHPTNVRNLDLAVGKERSRRLPKGKARRAVGGGLLGAALGLGTQPLAEYFANKYYGNN